MTRGITDGPGKTMEPNMDQAKRTAFTAHGILVKLKTMGLSDDLDRELAILCTDLADMWGGEKMLSEGLEEFLESPNEWEAIGDCLVDLRVAIDHVAWHARSIRKSMNRITRFAYRKAAETEYNS